MGFWDKWTYQRRNNQLGEPFKLDGVPHKTAPIAADSVSTHQFVAESPGITTLVVYEATAGANYMRVAWISEAPGGPPLPGAASWLCPDGVQRGMGVNIQVDVGNTRANPSGIFAAFMTKHVELQPNKVYTLNIMNEGTGSADKAAAFKGYPVTA